MLYANGRGEFLNFISFEPKLRLRRLRYAHHFRHDVSLRHYHKKYQISVYAKQTSRQQKPITYRTRISEYRLSSPVQDYNPLPSLLMYQSRPWLRFQDLTF